MTNTAETADRIHLWDNIKGILIFLVVFAHFLFDRQNSHLINAVVDSIYMFHMAVFVFISGYFGKSQHSTSKESLLKLVTAYIIFNGLMGILVEDYTLLTPMYSYWYILALIVWRFTVPTISKFKYSLPAFIILSLLSGYNYEITNVFSISRIIGFLPFYIAGYQLSEITAQKWLLNKSGKTIATGLFSLFLAIIAGYYAYQTFSYSDGDLQYRAYDAMHGGFTGRIFLYIIPSFVIAAFAALCPNKRIPWLTTIGRHSLSIYLLHRIFTLWFSKYAPIQGDAAVISTAILCSILLCTLLGFKTVHNAVNSILNAGAQILCHQKVSGNAATTVKTLFICVLILFYLHTPIYTIADNLNTKAQNDTFVTADTSTTRSDIIYPIMTDEQKDAFRNAYKIIFAGDLILLEDQVKRGYANKTYQYNDIFEYAKPYLESADLAIGVYEGPSGGESIGFSTSNYDDNKELALNFPDEFAIAVKNAGFDLVTTANNHVLDKGKEAAHRTLDLLDSIRLDHTGSYRSIDEKQNHRIKIVESQGIKFAILSYTYGSNKYTTDDLMNGDLSYITSIIPDISDPLFEKAKTMVEKDFADAQNLNPDLIIVLPHIGTQFVTYANESQLTWFDIFKENGADIILGDHSHSVQPVYMSRDRGKAKLELFCPGNFANVYREKHGDATALVEVYIDKIKKEVIGGSIIPMYVESSAAGNFRAIPTYTIMSDPELQKMISTDDIHNAEIAHKHITNTMLSNELPISFSQDRYYFNENGFMRQKTRPLIITDQHKSSRIYKLLNDNQSICFIGDSITHGTKNGGVGWFEPLIESMKNKQTYNISMGGATIKDVVNFNIPKSDLYIIAIGTNDIRYRQPKTCAMNEEEYIEQIKILKSKILKINPNAQFTFIAPWTSIDGDPYSQLNFHAKLSMNESYSKALKNYCQSNGDLYIDPNRYLIDSFAHKPAGYYLLDHIHPNILYGVELYSRAVLESCD